VSKDERLFFYTDEVYNNIFLEAYLAFYCLSHINISNMYI
jgi:hypothetical protein